MKSSFSSASKSRLPFRSRIHYKAIATVDIFIPAKVPEAFRADGKAKDKTAIQKLDQANSSTPSQARIIHQIQPPSLTDGSSSIQRCELLQFRLQQQQILKANHKPQDIRKTT